jgi:hypothetical protein
VGHGDPRDSGLVRRIRARRTARWGTPGELRHCRQHIQLYRTSPQT